MGLVLIAGLLTVGAPKSECKEGMRDDPVLIIRADKNHYVYFLPHEMKTCERYSKLFVQRKVKRVCGCKVLKAPGMKDRLRLRCAHWVNGKVLSATTAIYYYYPESTGACNKMRDHLMFKTK